MSDPKGHHWVPQKYLERWQDKYNDPHRNKGEVWSFPKEGGRGRRFAPAALFKEDDLYTLSDSNGDRDVHIENELGRIETVFSPIRSDKLEKMMELSPAEHVCLCAFLAAMEARSQKQRNYLQRELTRFVERSNHIHDVLHRATDSENRKKFPYLPERQPKPAFENVGGLIAQPMQILERLLSSLSVRFSQMNIAVLCCDYGHGFITSDAPCVRHDAQDWERTGPSLLSPSTEITLPISPQQMVFLNNAGISGYYDVPERLVDVFNRRTILHADRYIVTSTNCFKREWLLASRRARTT